MSEYLTLKTEAMEKLKRPFAAQYHDFVRGFVYLAERAVCERIEQVDPGWGFVIEDMHQRGEQVIVTATMTILGVKRQGVGMSEIKMIGKSPNEAEKGAATDALRRCARLFGVGRYLLDVPDGTKNESSLAKWLKSISGEENPPQQQRPAPKQSAPKNNAPPRKQPTTIEAGEKKQVTIVKRITKNEKPKLWFRTSELDGSLLVKAYSRQPFIDKLYCTETDWMVVDEAEEMKFTSNIVMGKYGWWEFDFASLPEFDPKFGGSVREQQTMPGTPPEPRKQWDGDIPL